MASKKDVEACSEGLVLITNECPNEFKKLLQEVLAERRVASGNKPNLGQYVDSKPSVTQLEGDRLLRLKEVLEYIPVGKSTWWAGVKSGRYPAPVHHLGPRITAWSYSSIMHLVNGGFNDNSN